jgi:Ca2+-dependent lipid-binding protein
MPGKIKVNNEFLFLIYQFLTIYSTNFILISKIKLRIISARNLPIMDRSSDSSDAFVEVRFGANIYDKTPVCKKSLDPEWNSRFVFEVEEDEIQEEPLQIRYFIIYQIF